MTKLLDHENRDLQLLGWNYVSNVLKLICKVISESGVSRSPQIEHLLTSSGLTRVLPDLDFILNVRARYCSVNPYIVLQITLIVLYFKDFEEHCKIRLFTKRI